MCRCVIWRVRRRRHAADCFDAGGHSVRAAESRWQIKLEEYQRHRLLVYFGKDFAPKDATPRSAKKHKALQRNKSYNVEQALISVGSGGLTGKGWRQGHAKLARDSCRARWRITISFSPSLPRRKDSWAASIVIDALHRGAVYRDQNRRPGARSPGKIAGRWRGGHALQPCLHQYRHEHSLNACDGYSTAAA